MRSAFGAVAIAVLLTGCTATGQSAPEAGSPEPTRTTDPAPTPSVTVSSPAPTPQLPRDAESLADWAARALPENALGGSPAIARGTGQVGSTGASVEIPAEAGGFDVVLACQSTDGTPIEIRFGTGSAASEVPCARPGESAPSPTRLAVRAGTVLVDTASDAVFVYEVHPRTGT